MTLGLLVGDVHATEVTQSVVRPIAVAAPRSASHPRRRGIVAGQQPARTPPPHGDPRWAAFLKMPELED